MKSFSINSLHILIFWSLSISSGYSQFASESKQDSIVQFEIKSYAAPLSLMAAGIAIELSKKKESIQEDFFNTDTDIDDYIQYMPIITSYGADVLGGKSKNGFIRKSMLLGISEVSNLIIVLGAKRAFNHRRPSGKQHSFPSGHTSQAFVGATALYEEYKDSNKWIAYSGYLFATATGVLRVSNDDHWTSDVLVGAGLGILVTKLVYYVADKRASSKNASSVFIPFATPNGYAGLTWYRSF